MTLLDHLFALISLVGFPVWGAWNSTARNIARLARQIAADPSARTNEYFWTIAMEWGLTLALLAWWQWAARPLTALGVILPEGTGAWWTLLVCTVGIGFYAQQAHTVAASPDAQATLRKQVGSQPNVRMILPATVREARVFRGGLDHRRDLRGTSLPRLPLVVPAVAGTGPRRRCRGGCRVRPYPRLPGHSWHRRNRCHGRRLHRRVSADRIARRADRAPRHRRSRQRPDGVPRPSAHRKRQRRQVRTCAAAIIVPTFPGAKNSAGEFVPAFIRTKTSIAA